MNTIKAEQFYIYNTECQSLEFPMGFKNEGIAIEYMKAKASDVPCKVLAGAALIKDGSTRFDAQGNLFA